MRYSDYFHSICPRPIAPAAVEAAESHLWRHREGRDGPVPGSRTFAFQAPAHPCATLYSLDPDEGWFRLDGLVLVHGADVEVPAEVVALV